MDLVTHDLKGISTRDVELKIFVSPMYDCIATSSLNNSLQYPPGTPVFIEGYCWNFAGTQTIANPPNQCWRLSRR